MLSIGSRYFDAIGVSLVRGRAFTNADGGPGRQVVIINRRLAALYFKDQDPVGRVIRLSDDAPRQPGARMAYGRRAGAERPTTQQQPGTRS